MYVEMEWFEGKLGGELCSIDIVLAAALRD